jgi:hypothetical protein
MSAEQRIAQVRGGFVHLVVKDSAGELHERGADAEPDIAVYLEREHDVLSESHAVGVRFVPDDSGAGAAAFEFERGHERRCSRRRENLDRLDGEAGNQLLKLLLVHVAPECEKPGAGPGLVILCCRSCHKRPASSSSGPEVPKQRFRKGDGDAYRVQPARHAALESVKF